MNNHHTHHGKGSQDNHKVGQHSSHAKNKHGKQDHSNHHVRMVADFRKRFFIAAILSIPVLLFSPLVQTTLGISWSFPFDQYVIFSIATIIFIYGGQPFFKGLKAELKKKQPGMMTLVSVAISVAYGYSAAVIFGLPGKQLLWELVTLVDVMLLGHWIEMKSVMGASRALEKLAKLMPSIAHKFEANGEIIDTSVSDLKIGDRVLVKPGEKIPVDGIVIKGATTVNEAMITGETKPVEKNVQSEMIGGAINGEGSVTIEIKKVGANTYLAQIIELVRKSQANKSKTQDLANKAAMWLTVAALSLGTLTLLFWLFFTTQDFGFALERTIAVIVIACPHALGLAIPLVVAFSTSISASNGILIRNRTAFENARKINSVVFDKTGTLTKGLFQISDIIVLDKDLSREDLIDMAGSIEAHSEHLIAQAIAKEIKQKRPVSNFKAIPGKGVEAIVQGKTVKIVSPGYLKEYNIEVSNEQVAEIMQQGKTVVFVIIQGSLAGAIGLDDVVREEAKEAVANLKQMGIASIMLTGDSQAVAKRVAAEIGIEEYYAGVLPGKKSETIKKIQAEGRVVTMVGDGINDAPALAQADVGIAIGAGTDVAIEAADIILVKSDPRDVVATIELAKRTYSKMVQNLWWASGYNIIALPIAAGVLFSFGILLSPAVGAIFMSLSTVIVAINASLLKFQTK